ncbi:hypothetical protein HUU51_01345 [Candidatus Gracilibacteria bacterium]|nr:hypothetical protein [Candidatus Gracilibacteria bacterium]
MKIRNTNKETSIISFEGIDFMETKVNDILLSNIVSYLKSGENMKNFHVLPNGLKEHKISRAGYRMIEFPPFIDNVEKFKLFINSQDSLFGAFGYNNAGYFMYEGSFYLIVSKTENRFDPKYDYVSGIVKNALPKK